MKSLIACSLRYVDHQLSVLDQRRLPSEEIWLDCDSPQDMFAMIQRLQLRGAPLIGIGAALALALYAENGASEAEFLEQAAYLKTARPTAVNLMACIDRLIDAANTQYPTAVVETAEALFAEDKQLCNAIAEHGQLLIANNSRILTHCNTGSLVTTGDGTALGIISRAHQEKKLQHVYVDETRPLLQGARLTTWELEKKHIPYTLICDNMAAHVMQQEKVDAVIVGADRIACNGDTANKIGTYSLAVLARYHNIPFYVAAPYTTLDKLCESGKDILIEERQAEEVRGVEQQEKTHCWSPKNSPVYNPAFDVTPGRLVTAYILDHGVFTLHQLRKLLQP